MPDEPDAILYNRLKTYHAAALGQTIAAWAYFEFIVDEVIWALARLEPEQGACLTAQFSTVSQRFNALLSLATLERINKKHIGRLNAVRKKALSIADKRNRMAHDPWFYGHDSEKHYRLNKTAKSELDFTFKPVTEDEIEAIEKEFLDLTVKFQEAKHAMYQDFYALPLPSSEKST